MGTRPESDSRGATTGHDRMTNGAEGFSFAKRRGDNSFRLVDSERLPAGCRLGCMGLAFLLLWDLLNSSNFLQQHDWAWTYLIAPFFILYFTRPEVTHSRKSGTSTSSSR